MRWMSNLVVVAVVVGAVNLKQKVQKVRNATWDFLLGSKNTT
jgi:hypothetical protein